MMVYIATSIRNILYKLFNSLLYKGTTRKYLVRLIQKIINHYFQGNNGRTGPLQDDRIKQEKKMMVESIIQSLNRSIEKEILHPAISQKVLGLWLEAMNKPGRSKKPEIKEFYDRNGCNPPFLLVIAPGHACNLRCSGCYASSDADSHKLDWEILDRLVREARKLWNIKLVVFTGGEPFSYSFKGKDIIDIVKDNPDCLFLAFTNGTLVNRKITERIAGCKNLTLAFSVEGLEADTDCRRGKGTFKKILRAMGFSREAGLPFGISVTVDSRNISKVLEDSFLDYFFDNQGAFYGFFFQYLPIGLDFDFGLMPSPEQRFYFWKRVWDKIERKKLFLLDFLNHGTLVNGCISAGRDGGYLYIDWDGEVKPCVFAPYSAGNIHQIYKDGGDLNRIWGSPFFDSIRRWQTEYGFKKSSIAEKGNLLRPCPFRDHHGLFLEIAEKTGARADKSLQRVTVFEEGYHQRFVEYGYSLKKLLDPAWEKVYLKKKI